MSRMSSPYDLIGLFFLIMSSEEQKLQSKIISDLNKRGWIVVKTITLSKAGFPDIFAFKNGRTVFFEVKAKKGVKSQLQQHRIEQLQQQGFLAEFIDDYEDYLKIIIL